MQEKRKLQRVNYQEQSVIVVCDTQEKIFVQTEDVSPLGMGICLKAGAPDIMNKDIIIVAQTLIMYAKVTRQEKQQDGSYKVGISAKSFSPEVLEYLFTHIASNDEKEN